MNQNVNLYCLVKTFYKEYLIKCLNIYIYITYKYNLNKCMRNRFIPINRFHNTVYVFLCNICVYNIYIYFGIDLSGLIDFTALK